MPLRVEPRRDRKLNRLVKAASIEPLGRLGPLYDQGEPAAQVYLVRSGFLRLVEPESEGSRERTVGVAGPWELVGEEGLCGGVRRYRCLAGEPSTYQALESPTVFHVLKTTRRTFAALLQEHANDLELARHLAKGSTGPSARARVAAVVADLARRWGAREGKGILIPHRVTHQVLADLSGAHRSTVTTTLNDWIYDGVLAEARGGLMVAKPRALRELSMANGKK